MRFTLFCVLLATGSLLWSEERNTCSESSEELLIIPKTPAPQPDADLLVSDSNKAAVEKRLFFVIPNYRADQYQEQYTPLSTAGKFAIARSDSFDWPNYLLLAGYALQSQVAAGGFKHSGGLNGFGRYYSRSVADQIIGSYVTEAILPSLLHEDPRFFRLGKGPILYRTFYAATRVFVTKRDDGSDGFYISEMIGNLGVVAAGDIYYPESRNVPASLERYGLAIGNDMISNLMTEFWPDIRRKVPFLHKKA